MANAPVSVNLSQLLAQFPRYQDPNRIRTDVMNVSRHSSTLIPMRGTLTLNTGQECDLVMLKGTVPIFFRGSQYHTPVEIYITENYPNSPPTCYVRPTTGMSLKSGHKHVDQSGLVYLPYLHEWSSRTHTLVELCAHMSSVFGAEPPLFATPSRGAATSTANFPSHSRPSYTGGSSASSGSRVGSHSGSLYTNSASHQSPYSGGSPYVNGSPYQQGQPAAQPRPTPTLPPRPSPEDVRRDKEAALTAKLQGELQAIYNELRTDMDSAFETQAKLEDNQQELEEDVEELSRRKIELERLTKLSKERLAELESYLEEKKKEGEPSIDDLIEPRDALSQQMLRLVAENAAIEDGLYYLDVGVTDGVISMDVFLKEVRRLARKQFVARATMKKVERAQQEVNAQKASFAAEQAANRGGGHYPHLPPQQQPNHGRGYMGGPPPGYTRTAGGAGAGAAHGYGQPTAGWGGAAGGGGYPSYGRGVTPGGGGIYGAQAPHTQRR